MIGQEELPKTTKELALLSYRLYENGSAPREIAKLYKKLGILSPRTGRPYLNKDVSSAIFHANKPRKTDKTYTLRYKTKNKKAIAAAVPLQNELPFESSVIVKEAKSVAIRDLQIKIRLVIGVVDDKQISDAEFRSFVKHLLGATA